MSDPVADQHAITEHLNLRLALKEAKTIIAKHCQCELRDGKRVVWRYQRGKGYQWIPCKACARFWDLVNEIDGK